MLLSMLLFVPNSLRFLATVPDNYIASKKGQEEIPDTVEPPILPLSVV